MRCPYLYHKIMTVQYDPDTQQTIMTLQTTVQEPHECPQEGCAAWSSAEDRCLYVKEE